MRHAHGAYTREVEAGSISATSALYRAWYVHTRLHRPPRSALYPTTPLLLASCAFVSYSHRLYANVCTPTIAKSSLGS
jgi:hypothetical protein